MSKFSDPDSIQDVKKYLADNYAELREYMYRIALRLLRNESDAEDAVGDAYSEKRQFPSGAA